MVPATVAMIRRAKASHKRLPEFLAGAPSRCDRLRAEIEQVTDAASPPRRWHEKVRPLVEEAGDMLSTVGAHGTTLLTVPGKLVGEADSALLLSGQQTEGLPLASLGPATGLARLAQGRSSASSVEAS
jgi:rifampicin phosphotransferase